MKSYEKIEHPVHYKIPGKKECIEQMYEDYGMEVTAIFCLTNAYKYLYRAGLKPGEKESEDIAKARWYYNWIMEKGFHVFSIQLSETIYLQKYIKKELDKYEKSRHDK